MIHLNAKMKSQLTVLKMRKKIRKLAVVKTSLNIERKLVRSRLNSQTSQMVETIGRGYLTIKRLFRF